MKVLGLVLSLLLAYGAAAMGAFFPPGEWYAGLRKPPWNPPAWVFGPVWTVLYGAMAVAAWRVAGKEGARTALVLYALQLLLNGLWSWLFFGLHRPDLAFLDIAALWLAVAATTAAFFPRDALAGWLMVPYLLWVGFAGALNLALWRLNPA